MDHMKILKRYLNSPVPGFEFLTIRDLIIIKKSKNGGGVMPKGNDKGS